MLASLRIRHLPAIAAIVAGVAIGDLVRASAIREQQEVLQHAAMERNRLMLAAGTRPSVDRAGEDDPDWLAIAAHRNQRMLVAGHLTTALASLALVLLMVLVLRPADRDIARALHSRDQALKELRRTIRGRGQLLGRVSQQLRTPMNGVIGMAELLLASDLTRPQQEYARLIDLAARELLSVVTDVLAWTRMEAGDDVLQKGTFNLSELLDLVLCGHQSAATARGLNLSLHIDENVPARVVTDEQRVMQILNNLLTNAIRYTAQGEVRLLVETADSELRFTVADTGRGMSPEQIVRALSCERRGSLDARDDGAIGIGLLVSGHLSRQLSGRLTIDSQLNRGTRITLHVPVEQPAAHDGRTDAGFRGMRALVIAPLPLQRRYLKDTLEGWGAIVETEEDPLRALGRMREAGTGQAPLDFAVISEELPHMSGLELGMRTDLARGTHPLPMILLAGATSVLPRREAIVTGFSELVPHPWRPGALREAAANAVLGMEHTAQLEIGSTDPTQRIQPAGVLGESVLVAENNPVNQMVLRGQLERLGLKVTVVTDGDSAIETGLSMGFAAIFLDMRLAGRDGLSTARALQDRLGALCPPIVMLAADDQTTAQTIRDAGASAVLAMPFTRAQLETTLHRCIANEVNSGSLRSA